MKALKALNKRYELLSVIKGGKFATVYRGYDRVLSKDIVIKEIDPSLVVNINQFQQAIRNIKRINHQNVVHIFDLVESDPGPFYIVMEYIDGLDLLQLLHKCQESGVSLPQYLAVFVIAEVCKALDYTHNYCSREDNEPLNIIHHNISPSNIMISKNGTVKLIDFNVAGLQKRALIEESAWNLPGEAHYLAPEQVTRNTLPDKRSDLYALGLVLYESLRGESYFQGNSPLQTMAPSENGRIKLKELDSLPKPLQLIARKALATEPENRYQNANQFYIDLMTYLFSSRDSSEFNTELGDFIRRIADHNSDRRNTSDSPISIASSQASQLHKTKPETEPEVEVNARHEHNIIEPPPRDLEKMKASSSQPPAESTRFQPGSDLHDYVEAEDEIKTTIDMHRLNTREDNKLLTRSVLGFLGVAMVFFLLDFAFQFTTVGSTLYDYLFPPAIKIHSVPSGAQVFLNDKLLPDRTPISIDKIQPGIYELKLTTSGYAPIIKSLQVFSKGKIFVKGTQSRRGNLPYIFKFKTTLELDSVPPGAEVFLNNIKFGKPTPCTVTWEVGEPCSIEMKKPGFADLKGYTLDTEQMTDKADNRELWQLHISKEPYTRYKITGLLGKFITIDSNPPEADIYLDDNPTSVGTTGAQSKIFLTAGSHKITLKKRRYNSKIINLEINETAPSKIFENLTRPVQFFAYDVSQANKQDIGAVVTQLIKNNKGFRRNDRTPCRINLQPDTYYAVLTKTGYKDVRVRILPSDSMVVAKMEPLIAKVRIAVLDGDTGLPINNVKAKIQSLDNPYISEKLFDTTDENGTCSGELLPGLYLFIVEKNGYNYQEKAIMIQSSHLNSIEFNLTKP
jgi:serine/threonine protein kinase